MHVGPGALSWPVADYPAAVAVSYTEVSHFSQCWPAAANAGFLDQGAVMQSRMRSRDVRGARLRALAGCVVRSLARPPPTPIYSAFGCLNVVVFSSGSNYGQG